MNTVVHLSYSSCIVVRRDEVKTVSANTVQVANRWRADQTEHVT